MMSFKPSEDFLKKSLIWNCIFLIKEELTEKIIEIYEDLNFKK